MLKASKYWRSGAEKKYGISRNRVLSETFVFFSPQVSRRSCFFCFWKKVWCHFLSRKHLFKTLKMLFCKMPLKNTRKSWKNTRKTWWIVQNTPCTRCQIFKDFILFRKKTLKNTHKSWYKHEKMWSDVQKPLNIRRSKFSDVL